MFGIGDLRNSGPLEQQTGLIAAVCTLNVTYVKEYRCNREGGEWQRFILALLIPHFQPWLRPWVHPLRPLPQRKSWLRLWYEVM